VSPLAYAPAALPDDLARHYARAGYRSTVTLGSLMRRNRDELGPLTAVIEGPVSLTWRELIDVASRVGGFLQAHGVGAGDVVVWQLPNWWESLAMAYGIWAAGAISSPVVPIYREHELRQVIEAVRPACVVAPESFRGVDHVALMEDACRAVGFQPRVRVILRGAATGWLPFEEVASGSPFIADDVNIGAPALVGFTSGTTSGAKGVAHSTASFVSSSLRSSRQACFSWKDRSYMPAPLAHATGLLSAVAIPSYTGSSVVLRDRWDAEQAIDDMRSHGVTFSSGAAIFIQELLAVLAARGGERLDLPSGYPCGGSTIPTSLAMAAEAVGMRPARSWGMTECPSVTSSAPFESPEVRCGTDGRIAPGCEVRVLDPDGRLLGPGEIGDLVVRGPQRALGYLDPVHTAAEFDDEGWFRTGDLGFVTADGTLSMTGRSKEIINRGGEKISGREIEDLLVQHPAVIEAAVVPAPHPRLGEQPAAFLLLRDGGPTDQELGQFLREAGLAPQKIPAVWRRVDELPRTASGKVKKYVLQSELAELG
jgi:acyl-CoA synthetase